MDYRKRRAIRQHINEALFGGLPEKALPIALQANREYPDFLWYGVMAGDIHRYYLNQPEQALQCYESVYDRGKSMFSTSTLSPYRYLLKRLSEMAAERKEYEKAIGYFSQFIAFQPSNFHEKDFCQYAEALVETGKKEEAIEVLQLGTRYSKSRKIRFRLSHYLGLNEPMMPFQAVRQGYRRIPVETDIIKPGWDIPDYIESVTKPIRQQGDIITIASCVVAVAESRLRGVDEIEPSFLAKGLSKCVHDDNFPFGGNAPLCNPLSMEVAIQETGKFRILYAAVLGGLLGKIIPKKGFFYRLAGEQAALIDDMPGAIPPFDYYVILGPRDSNESARRIREKTGCEAAVVDANDLEIAWAVGVSDQPIKPIVESVLSDNPAGNGDQKTPIILLRKE